MVSSRIALNQYAAGDPAAASGTAYAALTLAPADAIALNVLMLVEAGADRLSSAICYGSRAIHCDPLAFEIRINLGYCLQRQHNDAEALQRYFEALALRPSSPEANYNAGVKLHRSENWQTATKFYFRALLSRAVWPEAEMNLAQIQLLVGDWSSGWIRYESRLRLKEAELNTPKNLPGVEWNGIDSLNRKSLILWCEQGLGDSIQFFRYAIAAADAGAVVGLLTPSPLIRLFKSVERVRILPDNFDPGPYDYHRALMSMPGLMGSKPDNVPFSDRPYIEACRSEVSAWSERLGDTKGRLQVGITWRAGKVSKAQGRDMPLHAIMRLLDVDADFHALAKEIDPEEEALLSFFRINVLSNKFIDFASTAGLVSLMDIVISVDTSVAHLSAAMGKETWICVPSLPDWRWLASGSRSIWYRSARIYRQSRSNSWDDVVSRIREDLKRVINSRLT